MAVHEGAVDAALVPIENSLEGAVNATLDTLVLETEDVVIAGEVVHPIEHCLIAREQLALEQIELVLSHPAGDRPVRAVHPRAPAPAPRCARAARPPKPCAPWPSTAGGGPRSATAGRRSSTSAGCCWPASRTWPATRPGSCGCAGAHGGHGSGAPGGAAQDRDRVLGRRLGESRVARPLPGRVRRRGRSTSRGSSRDRAGRASGPTCSSPTSRGAQDDPSVQEALAAVRDHVETLRVLGSFPAA